MHAIDTDIFTLLMNGHADTMSKWLAIPSVNRGLPIVVADEAIRGRLNVIRQAEAGRINAGLPRAYGLFEFTLRLVTQVHVISYTDAAVSLFQDWRAARVRIGSNDLASPRLPSLIRPCSSLGMPAIFI
jgi:tRNA(fMet)-specific endonuclease VapC